MPKAIVILIAIVVLVSTLHAPVQTPSEFESFKRNFGVKFDDQNENIYREGIFRANLAKINAHNGNKLKTYELGINRFTHLTNEQFKRKYLGTFVRKSNKIIDTRDDSAVNIDWVAAGAVTEVKDQGDCGGCWTFSTTGALEGLSKIAYGTLPHFSQQQLLDCLDQYGNYACLGGYMDNAFQYVRDHGITTADAYPYKAVKGTCAVTQGAFKISGYIDVPGCNALASALVGRPISVAVDATNWAPYKAGIFNNCDVNLNHAVLLVGIAGKHWKIKNSWSTSWGEAGYIRLARGNTCGICNAPSYPIK